MEMKKRTYVSPGVEVTRVELESSICDGSTVFGDENNSGAKIDAQGVTGGEQTADGGIVNDFSGNTWGTEL